MSARRPRLPALPALPTDRVVQRILLAVDDSPGSDAAVRWVAERAQLHVLDVDLVRAGARRRPARAESTADAEAYLARTAPSAELVSETTDEDRVAALVERSGRADLVVLGGATAPGPVLARQVRAERIVDATRRPVVVVPATWRRSAGPVVVGVEGDGSDDAAVDFAAREAEVLHRALVLVHIRGFAPLAWPALEVDLQGRPVPHGPAALLDAVADGVRDRHPAVRLVRVVGHGSAPRALARAGRRAALLVVGTHSSTLVDRFLLGSVGRGVLARSRVAVAVVPASA